MSLCQPQQRARTERAARSLRVLEPCLAVDVLEPDTDPTACWTVDAVLRDTDGVPPAVLDILADEGLTLRYSQSHGDHQQLLATA